MRLLLDTHTLLWWVTGDALLSRRAKDLFRGNGLLPVRQLTHLNILLELADPIKRRHTGDRNIKRAVGEIADDLPVRIRQLCGALNLKLSGGAAPIQSNKGSGRRDARVGRVEK